MLHEWDFTIVWQHRSALLGGVIGTMKLTMVAAIVGTALAICSAVALTSQNRLIRSIATVIVEFLRGTPLLVLLLWAFYIIPSATGWQLSAFSTAALVFTLNFAAFAADIFRGSIRALNKDVVEASVALGMTRGMLLRRVIIPEVFRRSFPALNALFVGLLKLTSLASFIAVNELLYSASLVLADRPRPLEVYTAVAVLYLIMIIPLVALLRWLERTDRFALEPRGS